MPHRAKISDAHGITIELEDDEAGYEALGDKALKMLAAAVEIVDKRPTGSTNGLQAERRGTPDHIDRKGYGNRYFGPATAESELP